MKNTATNRKRECDLNRLHLLNGVLKSLPEQNERNMLLAIALPVTQDGCQRMANDLLDLLREDDRANENIALKALAIDLMNAADLRFSVRKA